MKGKAEIRQKDGTTAIVTRDEAEILWSQGRAKIIRYIDDGTEGVQEPPLSAGKENPTEFEDYYDEFVSVGDSKEESAINGRDVGQGYDVYVRPSPRKGEYLALVYDIAGKKHGMTYGFLPEDGTLKRIAIDIGNCPSEVIWEA